MGNLHNASTNLEVYDAFISEDTLARFISDASLPGHYMTKLDL